MPAFYLDHILDQHIFAPDQATAMLTFLRRPAIDWRNALIEWRGGPEVLWYQAGDDFEFGRLT